VNCGAGAVKSIAMYNIAVLSLKGVVVHVVHNPVVWFMCRAAHFLSLGAATMFDDSPGSCVQNCCCTAGLPVFATRACATLCM
jgi:hypothetical protein